MLKKIKNTLMTLTVSGFILVPTMLAAVPAVAHAASGTATTTQNSVSQLCQGASLNLAAPPGQQCDSKASTTISNLLKLVLNIISVLVGVTAVIMIVIGGFKYITSGGEFSRVSGAKDTILFAIIGLVVVALAQIIVHFVLSSLQGQSIGTGGG